MSQFYTKRLFFNVLIQIGYVGLSEGALWVCASLCKPYNCQLRKKLVIRQLFRITLFVQHSYANITVSTNFLTVAYSRHTRHGMLCENHAFTAVSLPDYAFKWGARGGGAEERPGEGGPVRSVCEHPEIGRQSHGSSARLL